jgi:Flp pilus assembly pilin Flp
MVSVFKNFRNDEDGAVTVDFVVLTAAIVVLGLAVGIAISRGAEGLANEIDSSLDTQADGVGAQTDDAVLNAGG